MKKIALIGDSHARIVFSHLKKMLPGLGFDNVYTRAENGWSVKQHIKKGTLPELKASKPDVILVSLGGNNQDMKESSYIDTVNQLLNVAKDVGAQVIWVGPTTSNTSTAESTEKRHKRTHEILSSYLPTQSVYYIDNRSFTNGGWGKDGVHYSSSFYKKWAERVAKYLKQTPTTTGTTSVKKYALFGGIGVAVIATIGIVAKIAFGGKKGSKANQTNRWYEEDTTIVKGSGYNTFYPEKFNTYREDMIKYGGWGDFPPIDGWSKPIEEDELEEYQEAKEAGYEHELDYNQPLDSSSLGKPYVYVYDGHHRALAAASLNIPIRIKNNE
jgi:hypothetical protein